MCVIHLIACLLLVSTQYVLCNEGETSTSSSDVGKPLILTSYLEEGRLEEARTLSKLTLHGWSGHSGYLTVNKTCGGQLFFWYFPAKNDPENAPLVMWLNGGPGSSTFFGFFTEVGHCNHFPEGFVSREMTWQNDLNMLYWDQPVGVGYSYPKDECLPENIYESTDHLYSAMVQFMQIFAELQSNKLYIAGQSFAGHYLPILASLINSKNQMSTVEVKINLAGMLIGNPSTRLDCRNYANFLYEHGYVDEKKRDELDERHQNLTRKVKEQKWVEAHDIWIGILRSIKVTSRYYVGPEQFDSYDWDKWINTTEARRIFHVGDIPFTDFNTFIYDNFTPDKAKPFDSYVNEVLNTRKISVGFYSGTMDMQCCTSSTVCLLKGLDWWGAEGYKNSNRTTWYHDGKMAGFYRSYGNMHFITVLHAGHSVPEMTPGPMYEIIKSLIRFDGNYVRGLNTTAPW